MSHAHHVIETMSLSRILVAQIATGTLCVSAVWGQHLVNPNPTKTADPAQRPVPRGIEHRSETPVPQPERSVVQSDSGGRNRQEFQMNTLPGFDADEGRRNRARRRAAGDPGILIYPAPRLEPKMLVLTPRPDVDPDMIIGNEPPHMAVPRRVPFPRVPTIPERRYQPKPRTSEEGGGNG